MADDDEPGFLVCVLATFDSPYHDNLRGWCDVCEREVQYRPDAPVEALGLKLLCGECWTDFLQDGDTVMVTERSIREAEAVLKRGLN